MIAQTGDSLEKEKEIARTFSAMRVDGIIACLSLETKTVDHFERLRKNGVPIVLFDRIHHDLNCSKVIVDNFDGAFRATEHLIKSGCKNLVHLGGPRGIEVFEQRANGFKEALKAHKMELKINSVLHTDLTTQDVTDSMKIWFENGDRPDGVFTANASTGLFLLHQSKALKIKIPEELAIISFGSEPCNLYIEPSLSAIEMPGFDMGKASWKQLHKEIESDQSLSEIIIKPLQLLIRNSSFKK